MKVASSADWRDGLAFETPVLLADLMGGDDARCFTCGPESEPLDRTHLWAFKHRHPKHHNGYVRFYCREHVPVTRPAPEPAPTAARRAKPAARVRAERPSPARRGPSLDDVRAMCPECFIEVSAAGVCGVCGTSVA